VPSAKQEIIKNSQLFWQLSNSQISKIIDLCQEESYEAGARIFDEGDTARNIYIVEEGKVALEMEIRIGRRTRRRATIDVITKGEVLGWSALSQKPLFTMSAIAIEKTILLVFNGKRLRKVCDQDPDLGRTLMLDLVGLVSDRLQHAKETLAHVLSVTSHDLRAPLATVQSCLDAVVGGFAGGINDNQKELLNGSRQRVSDLTSMIDNILDISYIEINEMDLENLSLPEVIDSSIGDVQGTAQQKRIMIENNVSTDLPRILGVPRRLGQVFTNLLSNAIKFTPADGRISINFRETDEYIQIEIADTGIGISSEELPRIFDDFYRGLKVDAEGVGLGLSIAKKIIEAHGGKIWAESPCSENGMGSKFYVAFSKVTAVVNDKIEGEMQSKEAARILIADDDPEMLKVTRLILESRGYQVDTASNGEEALAKIEEVKPDLLLLDLLMPVMDGFEVCKQLNKQVESGYNRIPILILSAVREESSRRRYELETRASLGVDGYIQKPISPLLLIQKVNKMLMLTVY
jgi:signal transduction histidine kinase